MLQRNMPQTETVHGPFASLPGGGSSEGGIGDIVNFALGLLRRQYMVILVTSALALALSVLYLRITPPTYTAQVQVLLGNPKTDFSRQQSVLADPVLDPQQIETQLQIIKSEAIAVPVIRQLNLADDPDFKASGVSLGSILQKIRSWFAPPAPQSAAGDHLSEGLIAAFQGRLQVHRLGYANIIEITYSSSSAARSAEIANAVANTFINDQLNAKFEANRSATSWLQERLRDLGEQALTAERAVSAFKAQNNIVSSEGKPIDERQITDLNSRLVAARAQTSDALSRLNRYEAIRTANKTNASSSGMLEAPGSDALNSPIINGLRQQYLELMRRESEWSARYGHDHLAVINLRTRMDDIRNAVLDEVRRLAESSRSDYEVAKQRQQEIEKQLNEAVSVSRSTNSAEITLREMESQAKNYRSLYETFLQRYMGTVQQESFPIAEARVIYPALTPESKSKPKSNLVLALGLFGGLALGAGLGLLRDLMDRVFRTSAQVETALSLPCLSLVPLLHARKEAKTPTSTSRQPDDDDLRQRHLSAGSRIHRTVVDMPLSRFAEAIRSIKLAIDLNRTMKSNKVIGLTSALPNEGKTTLAASLAQLIAHSGRSVIIVDCDLRNPSLSASLTPHAAVGLVEVIFGKTQLEDAIWRDPKTDLVFLPAVRRGPLLHTSEIIAGEATRRLFERLKTMYEYVIVDLPPLSPVVDVRASTSLIDGYILVVEWGRTKIDVVQHALHTAPNIYQGLIGAVLNKTDISAMGRYDAYRGDYYGNSHYTNYGFTDPE